MELGHSPLLNVHYLQRIVRIGSTQKSGARRLGCRKGWRARCLAGSGQRWGVRSRSRGAHRFSGAGLVRDCRRRFGQRRRRHLGDGAGHSRWRNTGVDHHRQAGSAWNFRGHYPSRHLGRVGWRTVRRRGGGAGKVAGSLRRGSTGWNRRRAGRFRVGRDDSIETMVPAVRTGDGADCAHLPHAHDARRRTSRFRQRRGQCRLLRCGRPYSFNAGVVARSRSEVYATH